MLCPDAPFDCAPPAHSLQYGFASLARIAKRKKVHTYTHTHTHTPRPFTQNQKQALSSVGLSALLRLMDICHDTPLPSGQPKKLSTNQSLTRPLPWITHPASRLSRAEPNLIYTNSQRPFPERLARLRNTPRRTPFCDVWPITPEENGGTRRVGLILSVEAISAQRGRRGVRRILIG